VTDPVPLDLREPEIKFAHDGGAVRVIYHDADGRQVVDLYPREFANRKPYESAGRFASWLGALVAELGAARAEIAQLRAESDDWDTDYHALDERLQTAEAALGAARAHTDDLRLWIQEMRAVCQQEGSRLARHFLSELDALGAAVLGGEPE
jgi:hypothetical protein